MFKFLFAFFLTMLILAGCSQHSPVKKLYEKGIPGTAKWVVLPFMNSSESKFIHSKFEKMLTVILPSVGVESAHLNPLSYKYEPFNSTDYLHKVDDAKIWAKQNNISFAITGVIEIWRLTADNRPHIAIQLSVYDIKTDQKIWHMNGTREGKPNEDPYIVSRALIRNLLKSIPIQKRL